MKNRTLRRAAETLVLLLIAAMAIFRLFQLCGC